MSALTRNWRLAFGLAVLLALVVCAALAPWIAPHDPMAQSLLNQLLPPAWVQGGERDFLLGTDTLGRDCCRVSSTARGRHCS